MRCSKIVVFLVLVFVARLNESYRILCLFPFNGWSHFLMFNAVCKGLAKRGHQIDMISHFPSKKLIANYTDIIDLSGSRQNLINTFSVDYGKSLENARLYYLATEFGSCLCDLMGHEKMQAFVKNPPNDPPYDLVITEYLGSPCYLGFGHVLNAPVAVVTSFLEYPYIDHFMGNPFNFAFFPGAFIDAPVVDTFFDRLWNFLANYPRVHLFHYYTSNQNEIMRKYLGEDVPDIRELERNVSLALVNADSSLHGIRPVTPAIVEVGGLHIQNDESELTSELKDWLDSAEDGIVYFTLGSLTSIETLPRNTLLNLYKSFAKISPIKVLMKCTNATALPRGLPANVITSPWIPQIPVLRHKKTRVFITHGGLMGTQEAVFYGVPIVGIPIFADQRRNINLLVHKNVGVQIHIDNITEESMDAALNEVLHDPKYAESAKMVSKLFRDRPMSPQDTATYWIEYIIRNGPHSLRSPAVNLPWWKLNLIDVFAALIFCTILLTSLFIISLFKLYSLQNSLTNPSKKKKLKLSHKQQNKHKFS